MPKYYNSTLDEIGKGIIRCREARGYTSQELALRAGINATMLSSIENGQRNSGIETYCKIAEGLEVPLSDFQPQNLHKYLDVPNEMREAVERSRRLTSEQRVKLANLMVYLMNNNMV